MNWRHHVKLRHLFTEEEDTESVRKSMAAIADVLDKEPCFAGFRDIWKFRRIPDGDDVISPLDYANRLIDRMYDYADDHAIWID